MKTLQALYEILRPIDRWHLALLSLASLLVSLMEIGSVSGLMCFIARATQTTVPAGKLQHIIDALLGTGDATTTLVRLAMFLACFYLLRAICNLLLLYAINAFSHAQYGICSARHFNHFLALPTTNIVAHNSSGISQVIFGSSTCFAYTLSSLLVASAELAAVGCVYGLLLWIDWRTTLFLTLILGTTSLLFVWLFSAMITRAGQQIQRASVQANKLFQESFWNFSLLRLCGNAPFIQERFSAATGAFSRANAINSAVQAAPRFVLETVGFLVMIALITYVRVYLNDPTILMSLVSVYGLAFYRFLPSMSKILASVNQMMFTRTAVEQIHTFMALQTEVVGSAPISFKDTIALHNVYFAYQEKQPVLHNISLTITQGQRLGVVGQSGAGKSTLLQLLMGLTLPTQGSITIDGKALSLANIAAWRSKVGYIPQSVYLFDGTVAENVAFGRTYDEKRVLTCLQQAHIYQPLLKYGGLQAKVGEGGATLSGGQKQRIAIARALYSNPELLVFDEATSALDSTTEEAIMHEIYALHRNVTIIIVAHRLSTIAGCDVILELEHGSARCSNIPAPHTIGQKTL